MKLPENLLPLAGRLGVHFDEPGEIYPPVGYVPFRVLEIGNGDTFGFYWPIGREHADPLVCTTQHDAGRLLPYASSLEDCLRLIVQEGYLEEEAEEVAEWLGVDLAEGLEAAAFPMDVERLPEYGAAWFHLAKDRRRERDLGQAALAMLQAISSPFCFTGYEARRQCLAWLKQMPDEVLPGDSDPLWQNRHKLTFQTGVKQNDDFRIYAEAVEAYHVQGDGHRAIRLRMLIGELMQMETTAFQGRYGWSQQGHLEQLKQEIKRAGVTERLGFLPGRP